MRSDLLLNIMSMSTLRTTSYVLIYLANSANQIQSARKLFYIYMHTYEKLNSTHKYLLRADSSHSILPDSCG